MGAHAGGRATGGEPKQRSDRAGPNYGRVSRAALLAGASAFALAALGASGVARAACVSSPQIIATPTSGPISSNGGAITITGSGSITGGPGGDGVDALTCPITALTNQSGGTISGGNGASGAVGGAGGTGVSNARTITTLTNSGKIGGGSGGSGLFAGGVGVSNAGTITTLTNKGAISGGSGGFGISGGGASGAGVSNAGTIGTLTNSGAISGGSGGAGFFGTGGAGVSNAGTITTLSNSGAISSGNGAPFDAEGGAGVSNAQGATIGSLTNQATGTISGGSGFERQAVGQHGGTGVSNAGGIKMLSNAGAISGGSGGAGLSVRGGGGFGGAGGVGVANSGTIKTLTNTGTIGGGRGGSAATFGGTLTNHGAFDIGNTDLLTSTTVTADSLDNLGSIALLGNGSTLADLIVNGAATTTGAITIGAGSELDVTGSNSFTQAGGSTTVTGSLVASTIDANDGLLDFASAITSGDGVGALNIGDLGNLEFGAAVDSSHTISFAASDGMLSLGDAGAFSGAIDKFTASDAIDLLGQSITSLAYSGSSASGVLTVTGSSGTIATLAFNGNYKTTSFTFASDGHGGSDILHT